METPARSEMERDARAVMREVAPTLCSYALLALGNGLLSTAVALRMVGQGDSTLAVGLVQAFYYAGLFAGCIAAAPFVGWLAAQRARTWLTAVTSCSAVAYIVVDAPTGLAILRALSGLSMVGLFVMTEAMLSTAAGRRWRGRVFALYLVVNFLCLGAGQFLLALGREGDPRVFAAVGLLFAVSLLPLRVGTWRSVTQRVSRSMDRRADERGQVDRQSRRRVWIPSPRESLRVLRTAPLGYLGCLIGGMTSGAYHALAPVYAARIGMGHDEVARFMGLSILCGLLLQWPTGFLADRRRRSDVLRGVAALAAVVALTLATGVQGAHARAWLVWPLASAYAALAFTIYGLAAGVAHEARDERMAVSATSLMLMLFALGATVAPPLAGALMMGIGPSGLFVFAGAALALLAAAAGRRRSQIGPVGATGG